MSEATEYDPTDYHPPYPLKGTGVSLANLKPLGTRFGPLPDKKDAK